MLHIREKKPDGKTSFKNIYDILENGIRASNDMRPVWNGIIPDIKQALRYTFSSANPSGWDSLKAKYRDWKVKHGYPVTIGIMTGALKSSLVDTPRIKLGRKKMQYSYNQNVQSLHKRTKDYAKYFDAKRPIMGYAREYINKLMKKITEKYIRENMKSTKLKGGFKYV